MEINKEISSINLNCDGTYSVSSEWVAPSIASTQAKAVTTVRHSYDGYILGEPDVSEYIKSIVTGTPKTSSPKKNDSNWYKDICGWGRVIKKVVINADNVVVIVCDGNKYTSKVNELDKDKYDKQYGVLVALMKCTELFNSTDIKILGTFKNCVRFAQKFIYSDIMKVVDTFITKFEKYDYVKKAEELAKRKEQEEKQKEYERKRKEWLEQQSCKESTSVQDIADSVVDIVKQLFTPKEFRDAVRTLNDKINEQEVLDSTNNEEDLSI